MSDALDLQSTTDAGKFRRWLQDINQYQVLRSADQDYLDFDLTNPQAVERLLQNRRAISIYLTFVRHYFNGLFRFIDLVQGAVEGRLLPAIHYADFLPRLAPTLFNRMLLQDHWRRFAIRHEDFDFEVLPLSSLTCIWNHACLEPRHFGLAWFRDRDGRVRQRFLFRADSNWRDDPRTWRPVEFDPVDAQRSRVFLIGLFFDLVRLARELAEDQAFAAALHDVLQPPPAAGHDPDPQPFPEDEPGDQPAGNPPQPEAGRGDGGPLSQLPPADPAPPAPPAPGQPPAEAIVTPAPEPKHQLGTGPLKLTRQPRPEMGSEALPKSPLVVAPAQAVETETYRPATREEKLLKSKLLQKVNGDDACATRLIEFEAERLPEGSLCQWLVSAIEKIERDETLCD